MDNREIMKKLTDSIGGEEIEIESVAYRKFVVFLIGENHFAVESADVKEVVIVSDLYFIPFVPPYVAGLINRHGEPHTVLDLGVILQNKKNSATKVLIMNRPDDQIAFLITDIEKIITLPEKEITAVPPSDDSAVFRGAFTFDGREVFIINTQEIYDRLERDIANS